MMQYGEQTTCGLNMCVTEYIRSHFERDLHFGVQYCNSVWVRAYQPLRPSFSTAIRPDTELKKIAQWSTDSNVSSARFNSAPKLLFQRSERTLQFCTKIMFTGPIFVVHLFNVPTAEIWRENSTWIATPWLTEKAGNTVTLLTDGKHRCGCNKLLTLVFNFSRNHVLMCKQC